MQKVVVLYEDVEKARPLSLSSTKLKPNLSLLNLIQPYLT